MIRLLTRLHEQILSAAAAAVLLRRHLPFNPIRRKATDSEALHHLHTIEALRSSAKPDLELVLTRREKSRRRGNRIGDEDMECGEGGGGNHVEVRDSFFDLAKLTSRSNPFFFRAEKRYHLRRR